MEIERSGNRHVRLDVYKTSPLEGAIGRDVKCIGLAEKLLELERLKVEFHAQFNAPCSDSTISKRGLNDV